MADPRFTDRRDAGRRLAASLLPLKGQRPLILALPRGGVPVADMVAQALDADMDLLLVRKIGVPWQPELALAALVENSPAEIVVNEDVARQLRLPPEYLRAEAEREIREIEARRRRYLGDRERIPVEGRVVVVVDDGIATGTTTSAALRTLRRQNPARLIVAVPVAPADTVIKLEEEADDVVCLRSPEDFFAVGAHYQDFTQVDDQEVADILARHRPGHASPSQ